MILTTAIVLACAGLAYVVARMAAAEGPRRRDYRTPETHRTLARAERRRETATPEFERRHGLAQRGSTP